MTITSSSGKGITVLTLSGRLDFQARQAFQSAVKEAERLTPQHIMLNLEDVTFMNSAGVGLIKQLIQQSKITKWTVTFGQSHGSLWGLDAM